MHTTHRIRVAHFAARRGPGSGTGRNQPMPQPPGENTRAAIVAPQPDPTKIKAPRAGPHGAHNLPKSRRPCCGPADGPAPEPEPVGNDSRPKEHARTPTLPPWGPSRRAWWGEASDLVAPKEHARTRSPFPSPRHFLGLVLEHYVFWCIHFSYLKPKIQNV